MSSNLRSKWFVLLVCVLAFAGLAVSQTSKGTVSGIVTDQTGAVVPNAKVTLVQQETNTLRETVSNAAGIYRFDAVNLGTYTVKITAAGFSAANTNTFAVVANQNAAVDVALKVGSSEQVVNIEAEAATVQLQTDDQLRGGNIESKQLAVLPISGQNSLNLMTLLPGVVPTNLDGGGSMDSGIGSVNGSRPRANNFMIDGVENNDVSVAGPALTMTNNDAIQEVSIQTANFSAEFGRSGGAVVNQITKSGTNRLHGTAAWVYRSEVLNASSFDERQAYLGGGKEAGDPLKSKFLEHIPAYTIGGPVVLPKLYDGHNKTFFFVAGQWDRYNSGGTQVTSIVPTANGIATLKSLAGSCANAQLYLNSIGNLVAPTATGKVDISVPTAVYNVTGSCNGNNRAGMSVEYGQATRFAPQLFKGNTEQARVDHTFTDKHQASFRYMWSPGNYVGAQTLGMSPEFDAGYGSSSYTGGISDAYTINNHITNELRLNYFRVGVGWEVLGTGIGTTLPNIAITNFTTLGTSSSFPQGRTFNTYQLQDTMTWVSGRHTVRYGFDLNKQIARQVAPVSGIRGSVAFLDSPVTIAGQSYTTTAFANYLDDFAGPTANAATRQFSSAKYYPNQFRQSYFLQDAWKVTSNLTLNAGLRYDNFGQPANDNFAYPVVSMDPATFPNKARVKADNNNFGPSVGFAYSPHFGWFSDGKTVIRGGFQVGYDGWYNNLLSNMAAAAPNNAASLPYVSTVNAANPRGLGGIMTTIFPNLAPAAFTNPLNATSSQFTENIRNPYTMRYSFGFQRELAGGLVLDASYVGSQSRKLFVSRELNPIKNGARLIPTMGSRIVRDSSGTSNYNGFQVDLRSKNIKTFVGSLMLDTNYTWSKTMDVISEAFATSAAGSAYSSSRWMGLEDLKIDYGVSDLDRRHKLMTSLVWDIRGPKNGFLGQAFGGWQISATIPVVSGSPFTVMNGRDRDGDGSSAADRPDIGNPNAPVWTRAIISTAAQACSSGLWNPDASACTTADDVRWVQSSAIPGAKTARRNSAWTDATIYSDVNILKKFAIREGVSFEARAEIFNITNSMNFNYAPNGTSLNGMYLNASKGGFLPWKSQIDYYTGPGRRTMRIGGKLIF